MIAPGGLLEMSFKLTITDECYAVDNTDSWVSKKIGVEVLTLHFGTGKMRVRSLEKHPLIDRPGVAFKVFDLPIEEFTKKYKILTRYPDI